jgi:uncharacterized phage-like protein YoqJ
VLEKTCCFAGHRKLPEDKIGVILLNLDREIERLIKNGVTTFISGGATGFDQIAASLIAAKKEMGCDVHLVMALPCHGQEMSWGESEKRLYQHLLDDADAIEYVSGVCGETGMAEQNQYMVDHSAYCICALLCDMSGTGQTVRYAHEKHRCVINVAAPSPIYSN